MHVIAKSSDADLPPKKRNRKATAHSEPPADGKMIAEMQPCSSRNSKQKIDKAKAKSEPAVHKSLDQLTCLPREIATIQIFSFPCHAPCQN
jgi:hypothetical protein